ncbi:MAG: hypothetical protein CMI53_04850 [Parcubacteria group bacterium]|mgnify:CR=1 FL=1|jgi:dihydrofolate reductase|nr:hypothetical protein [Parcubacteria group bacterium]|tara:strand:- start:19518 stop:20048 length:531 start_codon:yes stop_codon:yes gene_type:complete
MSQPKFTAVVVSTIDGKIAKNSKHNVNWSSTEDKVFLRQKIAEHDVVVVGRTTFKVARKALTKKKFSSRNYIVLTRSVKTFKKDSPQITYLNPSKVNLKKFVGDLGYKKICVLGGTQIYSLLLKKGLIDEIYLTIEPLVFGSGLNFLDGQLPTTIFKLIAVKKLNKSGTILLHYKK